MFQGNVNSGSSILVHVEYRELVAKVLVVLVVKKLFDGSVVEGKIRYHALTSKLQEYLEEYCWVWLILNQQHDLTLCPASVNTLE